MYPQIKRNAIKCLKCNDVIESKHRHDFVCCSCGSVCVDGGKDYVRTVGYPEDILLLTEYKGE